MLNMYQFIKKYKIAILYFTMEKRVLNKNSNLIYEYIRDPINTELMTNPITKKGCFIKILIVFIFFNKMLIYLFFGFLILNIFHWKNTPLF